MQRENEMESRIAGLPAWKRHGERNRSAAEVDWWRRDPARSSSNVGFTIVELMVVIAIIVVAAGFMTPSITDFLRSRKLENVRGTLGSTFNRARLQAVNARAKVSLVFFREGARIYDVGSQTFTDGDFNPATAPLASGDLWYELGFYGNRDSWSLPAYAEWQEENTQVRNKSEPAGAPVRFNVDGVPRVTFQRDGTLFFDVGADVGTTAFKKGNEEITTSDLLIKQKGNATWCFIDFRTTGQIRTKSVPKGEFPKPPPAPASGQEDDEDE